MGKSHIKVTFNLWVQSDFVTPSFVSEKVRKLESSRKKVGLSQLGHIFGRRGGAGLQQLVAAWRISMTEEVLERQIATTKELLPFQPELTLTLTLFPMGEPS